MIKMKFNNFFTKKIISNKKFDYKEEKYKGAEFSVILYDDNLD